jgi:hypothetical protein
MRVLDLDLDFFLNKNAYAVGHHRGRLGGDYKPWSVYRVGRFLEGRCGLSAAAPITGCTVKNHDEVLHFWRGLIESGQLQAPFDVVHIDAHPDIWVGGGLSIIRGFLRLQPEKELSLFKHKPVHEGNFLTYAIARRWIRSLVWVPLLKSGSKAPAWDGDARTVVSRLKEKRPETPLTAGKNELDIPYRILPWNRFHTTGAFDFIDLSRSPGFTPPASDALVSVVESYMRSI